jgi:hypothetical protein
VEIPVHLYIPHVYNDILTDLNRIENPVVTNITMTLLDSSGFYYATRYKMDYTDWGKDKGLDFV